MSNEDIEKIYKEEYAKLGYQLQNACKDINIDWNLHFDISLEDLDNQSLELDAHQQINNAIKHLIRIQDVYKTNRPYYVNAGYMLDKLLEAQRNISVAIAYYEKKKRETNED